MWTTGDLARALQSTRDSGPRHHRKARSPQGFRAFFVTGGPAVGVGLLTDLLTEAGPSTSQGPMTMAGVALVGHHVGKPAHVAVAVIHQACSSGHGWFAPPVIVVTARGSGHPGGGGG